MDATFRSPSFANRLAQLAREIERARSACHAALKRTHNESHLTALHHLLDVHASMLKQIDSVDEHARSGVRTAVVSRLTKTRVALNALASPSQTLASVLDQQKKLQQVIEDQIACAHLPLTMVLTIDEQLSDLVAAMRDLSNCIALQSDKFMMNLRSRNLREVISGRAYPRVPAVAPQPHRSTDY